MLNNGRTFSLVTNQEGVAPYFNKTFATDQMYSRAIFVTPDMAQKWLNLSKGNRPIQRKRVEQYKRAMLERKWQLTQDGPCFDTNGVLKNGHHRLTAVKESGCTVEMYVTFNVPAETTAYDIGRSRTTKEFLIYNEGMRKDLVNVRSLSIARLHMHFLCGENREKAALKTDSELGDFILENEEVIMYVLKLQEIQHEGKRMIQNAAFGYAVFCAILCGVDACDIERFCNVVTTGFYDNQCDSAAIVVRNSMQRFAGKGGDIYERAKATKIIQTGLNDFLRKQSRRQAYHNPTAVFTNHYLKEKKTC